MSGDHNMNQNDFNPDWLCTCGDFSKDGFYEVLQKFYKDNF